MRFSANLGFLWTEHALPEAIRCAKGAGFHAVECHWPYSTDIQLVKAALQETGLPMLGLNTQRGDVAKGDNGVAAVPGREEQAHAFIEESIQYAVGIDCQNIHVMAGCTTGDAGQAVFVNNLRHACRQASLHNKTILIEPLNQYDAPGYFLSTLEHALNTIDQVAEPNLKIMFDCYHMQIMGGDLLRRFRQSAEHIGHIQFASVPERAEPHSGEVDYPWLLAEIRSAGYDGTFGAEYKPAGTTDAGLHWMAAYQGA